MSLPLPRAQVFAFFAEVSNLQRITPPELGFALVTPPPIHISEGTRIEYRLHLCGIPFTWQSEIQRWHPPEAFADVQLRGPYKRWVHTIASEEDEATIIEDEVQYVLEWRSFLGDALLSLSGAGERSTQDIAQGEAIFLTLS